MRRRLLILTAAAAGLAAVLLPGTPAGAHPLGNFSINSYVGLTIHSDHIDATAIVDIAEIPTLQDRPDVDRDGDGSVSIVERSDFSRRTCATVARDVTLTRDTNRLEWTVVRSAFDYAPGAGGLDVSRLTCDLTVPTTVDTPTTLAVDNTYLSDRIGWRELTAAGDGVRLIGSPVPATSISHELRDYPKDLLSSTLDVRAATLRVEPGAGASAATGALPAGLGTGGDPVSRWLATLDRHFADLAGGTHLTVWVGLLAVLLAALLGAGHAALPGHGKTVLAAYLAGRRGRPRDALAVAGTVTLTHTGGVLALGLLLTAGAAVAGEQVLGWLGLVSGAVVLSVGVSMAVGVIRRHRSGPAGHVGPGPDHHHGHGHHGHGHHGHDHDHHHLDGHHDHQSGEHSGRSRLRRRLGLAGIGLAGGLVPSPSALVVLLGAIGLGRTGFGIGLVVAYGAGMAATLTGAGLLLLALQRRLARAGRSAADTRLGRLARRVGTLTPAVTAGLVLVVGAGLAVRAAAGVL